MSDPTLLVIAAALGALAALYLRSRFGRQEQRRDAVVLYRDGSTRVVKDVAYYQADVWFGGEGGVWYQLYDYDGQLRASLAADPVKDIVHLDNEAPEGTEPAKAPQPWDPVETLTPVPRPDPQPRSVRSSRGGRVLVPPPRFPVADDG